MKLFNGNEIDWAAFNKGREAWSNWVATGEKESNPYKKETDQWYSWNKGWND